MSTVSTCLIFDTKRGHEAAQFYVSVIANSAIGHVMRGADGAPMVTEFTLDGAAFAALDAGPDVRMDEAVSIVVNTPDQAETDRIWDALVSNGGQASRCGWLRDRYGVSWQIVPKAWMDIIASGDEAGIARAFPVMLAMGKLEIEPLKRAFEGTPA